MCLHAPHQHGALHQRYHSIAAADACTPEDHDEAERAFRVAMGPLFANPVLRSALRAFGRSLYIVRLDGGLDPFAWFPLDSAELARVRPTLYQSQSSWATTLGQDEGGREVGLDASLSAMLPYVGDLRLVFGTGLVLPEGSHTRASDMTFDGATGRKALADGWAGRAYPAGDLASFDLTDEDAFYLSMGVDTLDLLKGPSYVPGLSLTNPAVVERLISDGTLSPTVRDPSTGADVRRANAAATYAGRFSEAVATGSREVAPGAFGEHPVAEYVRTMVAAKRGGFAPTVKVVSLDSLDTHNAQALATARQGQAFAQIVAGVRRYDPTALMLFIGEFGRRIGENSGRGTDHGRGGVAILVGDDLGRGGIVGGRVGSLSADPQGLEIAHTPSDVYAALLAKLGLNPDAAYADAAYTRREVTL